MSAPVNCLFQLQKVYDLTKVKKGKMFRLYFKIKNIMVKLIVRNELKKQNEFVLKCWHHSPYFSYK